MLSFFILLQTLKTAPVVQWIEFWIPVPVIGVRISTGVLTRNNNMVITSFFLYRHSI